MDRFRIPEIFLGALLAVAIFALGAAIRTTTPKSYTIEMQSGQNTAPAVAEETEAQTNRRIADYNRALDWLTFVLVLANIALWLVTWRSGLRQSREMRDSIATARQSAFAAERAASAAQKTAETQIGAERAWFLLVIDEENFEQVLESRLKQNRWAAHTNVSEVPDPLVRFHFENFGRSPAFVKEIATEVRNLAALPSRLIYTPNIPWNEEIVVPAGGRIPNGKDEAGEWRLFQHTLTGIDELAARTVDIGESYFWFYGRVIYEDIWGNEHVTRFCWGHDGRLDWFLPAGGKRYNERT